MRLMTQLMLAGLLTGVLFQPALAGEPERGDCPPPPPGPPPQADARPEGQPPFDRRDHGPHEHFRVHVALAEFDLNKDGRITREEIDRALKTRFDEADVNHDGKLDQAEFAHARPLGPPPGEPHMHGPAACGPHHAGPDGQDHHAERHPPLDQRAAFNHFDWNLDGELSFEEFAAPIRQMALHLDRNGDGVIDEEEMKGPVMVFGPGFAPPPGPPPEPPRDR